MLEPGISAYESVSFVSYLEELASVSLGSAFCGALTSGSMLSLKISLVWSDFFLSVEIEF